MGFAKPIGGVGFPPNNTPGPDPGIWLETGISRDWILGSGPGYTNPGISGPVPGSRACLVYGLRISNDFRNVFKKNL